MDIKKLPDWRLAKATELTEDALLPSGRTARRGELVVLVTQTETAREGRVVFVTPGAPVLALNVAIRAARVAIKLRGGLSWTLDQNTSQRSMSDSSVSALFDYFEEAMIAATFSYQALEAFANQLIANSVSGTYPYRRKDEVKQLTADELERAASTEDKLATILPTLCQVRSPKGNAIWARFKKLKGVRDSATHLKSFDHYRRGVIDKESLYYRLMNIDAKIYPDTAIQLMRHFSSEEGSLWLDEATNRFGAPDV